MHVAAMSAAVQPLQIEGLVLCMQQNHCQGALLAARYSQHKTNQRKKGQPPGVVDVTVHPQQNRIVLQLSLQHAVDDEAGALLQPIAIVLIGDAGQNLLNASCICNTEAEHNDFMQPLLVDVSRCHSAMQNRRVCAAPHCCCFEDSVSSMLPVHKSEIMCQQSQLTGVAVNELDQE